MARKMMKAMGIPRSIPTPASHAPDRVTIPTTLQRSAPRAIRIPMSLRCWVTAWAMTP